MSNHTELPWILGAEGELEDGMTPIHSDSHGALAQVVTRMREFDENNASPLELEEDLELKGNAQLIVTAVNNHYKLVEALQEVSELDQMSMENAIGWLEDNCQDIRTLLGQLDGESK